MMYTSTHPRHTVLQLLGRGSISALAAPLSAAHYTARCGQCTTLQYGSTPGNRSTPGFRTSLEHIVPQGHGRAPRWHHTLSAPAHASRLHATGAHMGKGGMNQSRFHAAARPLAWPLPSSFITAAARRRALAASSSKAVEPYADCPIIYSAIVQLQAGCFCLRGAREPHGAKAPVRQRTCGVGDAD